MTLQGSSDEEAAGQFVVLKQACQLMGSIPWGSRGFNPNFLQVNSPFLISRQIHKKKKQKGMKGVAMRGVASANVLKDAVQDLVAQVGHADVDVITWPFGGFAFGGLSTSRFNELWGWIKTNEHH